MNCDRNVHILEVDFSAVQGYCCPPEMYHPPIQPEIHPFKLYLFIDLDMPLKNS